MPRQSVTRWIVRVLVGVVLTVLAVSLVLLLVLRTSWGRDYVRSIAEARASAAIGADVSLGRLSGSLLFDAVVDDVRIERDGRRLASVNSVRASYDPWDLLRGRIEIASVILDGPNIRAAALAGLGGAGQDPAGGPGRRSLRRVLIEELQVRSGRVTVGSQPAEVGGFRVPDVIRALDARLRLDIGAEGTTVEVDRLSFVGEAPSITLRNLSGTVVIARGDLVLRDISVQLAESSFEFGGTIANFRRLGQS